MSKNLFRKGLVGAALVGLGASVFAGAPAFAAELNLGPSAGTSTTTFVDQTFELSASFTSGYVPASYAQLSYQITSSAGVAVDADARITSGAASTAVTLDATDYTGYVLSTSSTAISQNLLEVKLHGATTASLTKSVSVVAFVDSNNDGKLTSADTWKTAPVVVTFKKYSEVTATPVLTAPIEGDTSISAKISFDGINNEQLSAGSVSADITDNAGNAIGSNLTSTQSTSKAYFTVAKSVSALAALATVNVKAKFNGVAIGTKVSAYATAQTVAAISTDVTDSTVAKGALDANTGQALLDAAFTATAVLTDADGNPVVGATATAAVTTDATLATLTSAATEKQLVVAGTSYSDNNKLPGNNNTTYPALTLTSDANGVVSVTISGNNLAANDHISIVFKSQNRTATTLVVTEQAATYTLHALNGVSAATTDSSAVTVPVLVVDQFGGVPADSYDVTATFNASGAGYSAQDVTASTSASGTFAPVVNGRATLTLLDNGSGVGTNTYTLNVQKRQSAGGYSASANGVSTINFKVAITTAAALTAGKIAVTGVTIDSTTKAQSFGTTASPVALNLKSYGSYDSRNVLGTVPTVVGGQSIAGEVKTTATASTASAVVPGAKVTVTGAGLEFKSVPVSGQAVYSVDSASVVADANGAYDITVYSNKAGSQAVTISSGAASQVVTIVFAQAADNTGKFLTITAPATAQSGTTITASVKLTDKYGNPVKVTNVASTPAVSTDRGFSFKASTGVGSVSAAATATDADGAAVVSITTQPSDAGTITLTATYDADGAYTDTTAAIKATGTIVVSDLGKAAADAAAAAKAAADLAASAKTVTATPAVTVSQVGRSVDVSVKALNAAGTAAAGRTVTFKSTGSGSLTALSAVTDANGVATVKLLAGVADNGDAVVTATVDGVSATAATVTFGTTDAQIDSVSNRVTAVASFTKGKNVAFYVDGIKKWSKISSSDADVVLNYNLKKGAHTVTVKVSGGFVTTEKFIVK